MDNPYAAATEVADKPATVNGASPKPTSEHPTVCAFYCTIGCIVGLQLALTCRSGFSLYLPLTGVGAIWWSAYFMIGGSILGALAILSSGFLGWLWSRLHFDYKRHFALRFIYGFLFANSIVFLQKPISRYLMDHTNWITDLLAGPRLDTSTFAIACLFAAVFSQTVESILSRAIFPNHPRRATTVPSAR